MPRTEPGVDKGRDSRLDIAVSEKGASVATRKLYQLADSLQKISPAAARSLRGKALRLGLNANKMVQEVAVAALDTVVHRTPVDTGRARANWIVKVVVSRPHTTPLFDKYDKTGDDTVAEGTAVIVGTPRPDGHSIYISNALPYIEALNNGHSKQAPSGYVELAVQSARNVVSNANLLTKK